ncbi:SDR family oxidoreductase [Mucilaginibacter sp. SG564]|uniref:SDR family oxidoreductase n=1 Tax=Mucilaginibacter sp. SG564 TaxID=2587022 RepID=UPI00155194A4|nr:NmrA family NAD(P)-binding protein [Mucilaginibacter sp. SG564]NOW95299.1 uncharacterized protein YbjT (DUF2867 family) [Mucilaginibacter sp. SG564]
MKNVLVTGGTGLLGREVVDQLLSINYRVSVLSSKKNAVVPAGVLLIKGDLASNRGLEEATQDADIIIHCASNPKDTQSVDIKGTQNLLNVIDRDKTLHFVYISIINVDKSNYSYYQTKIRVEQMIAASGIPFSVLRTTQFHNYVLSILKTLDKENGTLAIPDGMHFQSIEVKEAATLLIDVAQREPVGLVRGVGGPELLKFEEMAKTYLHVLRRKDELKVRPFQSEEYDRYRSENNIWPTNSYGRVTWEAFLRHDLAS